MPEFQRKVRGAVFAGCVSYPNHRMYPTIDQQESSLKQQSVVTGYFLGMERDEIVTTVAQNILAVMARRKMNAAELARAAGLNPTGVYDILSAKSRSSRLDTIGKIAAALDIPVALLFEERSEGELREQIVDAISRLTDADRRRILATVKAWTDVGD